MEARQALRQRIATVLHWSRLVLLCSILAGAAAWSINEHQTPIYQSATTLLIDAAPGTKPTSDYQSILSSERQALTYSELLTSEPLLETVIEKLGLSGQPTTLRRSIVVSVVRDTQLIRVQVRDPDPQRAAEIANTLVTMFGTQTHELQTARYAASKGRLEQQMAVLDKQAQQISAQLSAVTETPANKPEHDRLDTTLAQYHQSYANLLQSYEQVSMAEAQTTASVVQVEPATISQQPVTPRVLFNTFASAAVAFLLTIGLALLYDLLDDRVKGPDELCTQLGLPLLGCINHATAQPSSRPLVDGEPHSAFAEAFRSLRANLQFATAYTPRYTLLITSPCEGDGKSTLVANLGAVIAHAGKRVTLIDADLRHPRLHRRFDLRNSAGVSELLGQGDLPIDGLQSTAVPGLSLLTAGSLPPNPAELVAAPRLGEILVQLQPQTDMIIIDSPPLLAVMDAALVAQYTDGVVLVVRVGATKLAACRQAVERLRRADAHLLGIVINDIPLGPVATAYGYQDYHHDYHYASRGLHGRASPPRLEGDQVAQHPQ